MKYLMLLSLFFLLPQEKMVFLPESSFPVEATSMSIDNLGNVYTVAGDVLNKFSRKGKLLCSYNNKSFGDISTIDVSNPLRISVFYQDLSSVVFLDNTLSLHESSISLTEIGFDQTSVVCSSSNNGLWIYDQNFFELVWLDQNAEVQRRTGNLVQVLGREINPTFMLERHQKVYLNDPEQGIFVFDVFGGYIKTIPISDLDHFQVTQEKLYYSQTPDLKVFDLVTFETQSIPLPELDASSIHFNGESLFCLKGKQLKIFRLAR